MTTHFNTRHGHSGRGKRSQTYKTWMSMHRRCRYESQIGYEHYGGRGILVDPAWDDFVNFLCDMGVQPLGLTLERTDPNGNYTPQNCRWATPLEQARNRTTTCWLTFAGETLCLAEWAERLKIKPKTLRARLNDHGWSVERALTTPVNNIKRSS